MESASTQTYMVCLGSNGTGMPHFTLVRETQEEAGLLVIPDSIREFGCVRRVETFDEAEYDCFVQDNFYYLCRVERTTVEQRLDDYEA